MITESRKRDIDAITEIYAGLTAKFDNYSVKGKRKMIAALGDIRKKGELPNGEKLIPESRIFIRELQDFYKQRLVANLK